MLVIYAQCHVPGLRGRLDKQARVWPYATILKMSGALLSQNISYHKYLV